MLELLSRVTQKPAKMKTKPPDMPNSPNQKTVLPL